MNAKIVKGGKTLVELSDIRIAGAVGRLGTDFVATGGPDLMQLSIENPSGLELLYQGTRYNCMIQTTTGDHSDFVVRGKVWLI